MENEKTDLFDDDDELLKDLHPADYRSLVVYSRDWTVATVLEQINSGNIKLDPEFQRRNAWDDGKRSGLIESLIVGIPIPQLVLAEDPEKRKSYIVIDGRQRLLTLAGFTSPHDVDFWQKPELTRLQLRQDLIGESYETLKAKKPEALRELVNADIRCAVIASTEKTNDLLYYVFFRLNSGSVTLSTQELRQALSRGPFSAYLNKVTNHKIPLHTVMGLNGTDNRYRDAEVLLRYLAFSLFLSKYRGNLKEFLDNAMQRLNSDWALYEPRVITEYKKLDSAIKLLEMALGENSVGRRPLGNGSFDRRFNRALFEVEVFYFKQLKSIHIKGRVTRFRVAFNKLFAEDDDFRASISATTKSLEQYRVRFEAFGKIVNRAFNVELAVPSFI